MTSNITIYANPSVTAWITDRMTCCRGDARNTTTLPLPRAVATLVSTPAFATLSLYKIEWEFERDAAPAWNPLEIQSSYSLPNRRSASRTMTSRVVPMQDAAKAPRLETCHDSARKQESIVYQFHSIWDAVLAGGFGLQEVSVRLTDVLHDPIDELISMSILAVFFQSRVPLTT